MSSSLLSGIDVSYYQTVDWQRVKQAGITFAFARATYGDTKVDPKFHDNWEAMRAAGIVRGPYHFYIAADDPTRQANLFLSTVGTLDAGDLPPVIDVEADSGVSSNLVSGVQTWLDLVEQKLGRRPVIYTAPAFWNEHMTGGFGSYPLWVAEYGVHEPKSVHGWSTWAFWQYSESGAVEGVEPAVDLDRFNGSLDDLEALIKASSVGTTTATPTSGATTATPTATPTPDAPAPPDTPAPPAAPPAEPPAEPPAPSTDTQTYTVRHGDTLSSIAERFGTTVDAICEANRIENPNLIEAGQVLTIP